MSADRLRSAVAFMWWAPSLAAAPVRFVAEMAAVDVLFAIRRDRAARRVLAGVIRRNRRALQVAKREAQRR